MTQGKQKLGKILCVLIRVREGLRGWREAITAV